MAEIFSINTLTQASAWLEQQSGASWSPEKLVEHGIYGRIALLAVNPDWVAPGVGELQRTIYGNMVPSISDGLVATNSWLLQTLQKHGRASLTNLPRVVGTAPWIDIGHLRVLEGELIRFLGTIGLPDNQSTVTVPIADEGDLGIPGRLPRIGIGKLAIEAAWRIEQETGRGATVKDVMQQLHAWGNNGDKPDVILKSEKSTSGVQWRTTAGKLKTYDAEACGKALGTWQKTRA